MTEHIVKRQFLTTNHTNDTNLSFSCFFQPSWFLFCSCWLGVPKVRWFVVKF